jgi:hypothetical protein
MTTPNNPVGAPDAPIQPIRFSPERCVHCQGAFDHLTDRMNRAMILLEQELKGLAARITALEASQAAAAQPQAPAVSSDRRLCRVPCRVGPPRFRPTSRRTR